MSAKAKQERDDVEIKLVSMKLSIEDVCSTASPTKRLVKKRREELRVTCEKLQTKHLHYCKAASLGGESAESVEFLKKFGKMYNEAEEVITNTLGSDDATADEIMIQRLKKRVKSLQTEKDPDIPHINDLASPGQNSGAYEEANKMLEEA